MKKAVRERGRPLPGRVAACHRSRAAGVAVTIILRNFYMIVSASARPLVSRLLIALFTVASLAGFSLPAAADDVTFIMNNGHPNAVRVELYSQDRNQVWPGGNQTYYLDDSETKEIGLSCNSGESICYGAWIDGDESTYWGVGPNDKEQCSDCCYTCESGETEEINLVP